MRDLAPEWFLEQEARALLTRLSRIRPLVLQETMVRAAGPSPLALARIETLLYRGRRELATQIGRFLQWLASGAAARGSAAQAQQRLTHLKLRFNAILGQLDIFSEAMSQRSEAETGVFLAGLDAAASDALSVPGVYENPPVLCYLARDPGGAIRRVRTRLPGGGDNPVALIRLPRERMVGSGIASSLVHEVGHQATHSLGLVRELRALLTRRAAAASSEPWALWAGWLSEALADLWAIARVGVTSTLGLVGLVSLPRAFVFRHSAGDPHPIPWLRVKLSCAFGAALYPDAQWRRLATLWESLYPLDGLPHEAAQRLRAIEASQPAFIEALLSHQPEVLGGASLFDALVNEEVAPARLSATWARAARRHKPLADVRPTVALAALGQARIDGRITPERESSAVADLLQHWAVSAITSAPGRAQRELAFA